jgi:hypothetical protein
VSEGSRDTIFTEVGIAGRKKVSPWRDSTQRRLDAIRLLPPRGDMADIFKRDGTVRLLKDLGRDTSVELIEVKQGLSEAVIGQCLVGRELFARQYPHATIHRTVALCKVADPAMTWVCKQLGIEYEVIENPTRPGDAHTSRTFDLFDDAMLHRMEAWRRDAGGLCFTRIPVGGDTFGPQSGTTYATFVRIPRGPDLLARFDTRDRFLAAVGEQAIDLIEVRAALTRGVVGRLLAHAHLLEHQYGVRVARKLVLVGKTDEAIAWACEKLGVEVVVVGGGPHETLERSHRRERVA